MCPPNHGHATRSRPVFHPPSLGDRPNWLHTIFRRAVCLMAGSSPDSLALQYRRGFRRFDSSRRGPAIERVAIGMCHGQLGTAVHKVNCNPGRAFALNGSCGHALRGIQYCS